MKTFAQECEELRINGGILKDEEGSFYYKPGFMWHRVDGPACDWSDGDKWWYYNNKLMMETHGDVTPEQVLDFKLRIL